ncbi:MAG: META domain-containing protein [Pseudomonadales bacterium]|nr:META domain-containing protein [Pseudomonadales bacterium]
MKNSKVLLSLLVLLAIQSTAGCSDATTAMPMTETKIDDVSSLQGQWHLEKVIRKEGEWLLADDAQFTLFIDEKGHASGAVACNRFNASSSISENTFTLAMARTTRMRCHSEDDNVNSFTPLYLQQLNQGMTIQHLSLAPENPKMILANKNHQRWVFIQKP